MKNIWKQTDRLAWLIAVMLCLIVTAILWYFVALFYLPNTIYISENSEKDVNFHVPVSVQTIAESGTQKEIPATKHVRIASGKEKNVQMKLDLFGVLPAGNMNVNVVRTNKVIPGGIPIGIYLHTDGVLVLGTGEFLNQDGKEVMPAKNIVETGDYIMAVNQKRVQKKEQVIDIVKESGELPIQFLIERDGVEKTVLVSPQKDMDGAYKVGIWVSDSMQGIGTLSFVTEDGKFAALGHGICDNAKGELLQLGYGALYQTDIVSIERGKKQDPGELTGLITLMEERELGDISVNDERGIFGQTENGLCEMLKEKAIAVGYKEEVEKGPATILCQLDGSKKEYQVEIEAVHNERFTGNRDIEIRVTDEQLIQKTGGIVQGMSGSPILQNGKMIGVVTHVFVDDPTKGYGIYLEEMLGVGLKSRKL